MEFLTTLANKEIIKKSVIEFSLKESINPNLVYAIIWQESKLNPNAMRYEPGFYIKYIEKNQEGGLLGHIPSPNLCTLITEKRLRAFSYGLMQIMGQTAREMGFRSDYLCDLLDIKTNILFGVRHLVACLKEKGNTKDGLLKYNGGGDKQYPNKIFAHMDSGIIGEKFL